mmetsp:Transcript_388/g.981  ORF Transcript_388/g.981 Transcript_388/m.981 type:complete len:228 (-) Transcript_388:468-1151(-)
MGVVRLAAGGGSASDGGDPQGAAQPPLPPPCRQGLVHHARLAPPRREPRDRRDGCAALRLGRLPALREHTAVDDTDPGGVHVHAGERGLLDLHQPAHPQVAAPRHVLAQHRPAHHAGVRQVQDVQVARRGDCGLCDYGGRDPHLDVRHERAAVGVPHDAPDDGAVVRRGDRAHLPRAAVQHDVPAGAGVWPAAGRAAAPERDDREHQHARALWAGHGRVEREDGGTS